MGLHKHGGTMDGGLTPICEACGVSLCWDIEEGEALALEAFWNQWKCQDCNHGVRMSIEEWKARHGSAVAKVEPEHIAPLQRDELVTVLKAVLKAHGWTEHVGAAIAQKSYQTAVGPRVAHTYLSRGDEFNFTICGDYQSEGRNALEPHGVLVPKTIDPAGAVRLIVRYARGADAAVAQTYAAKLWHDRNPNVV